ANVFEQPNKKGFLRTMSWGDQVEVLKVTPEHVEVRVFKFEEQEDGTSKPVPSSGFIVPPKSSGIKPKDVVREKKASRVLMVNFVDVQQGDGAVVETPKGRIMLVDGGENVMFARYLASRFRRTQANKPKEIDCIVVSHGDADHFGGLIEIFKSEENKTAFQRLFIHPQRVYHNGLVKRPSSKNGKSVKDVEMLGATKTVKDPETGKDVTIITGLETDLTKVPDAEMNKFFLEWKHALSAWKKRGKIEFRHLQIGDHDAFDFLADEDIKVEVLGPIPTEVGNVKGLKFLGSPPKGPRVGHESLETEVKGFSGKSASHTINGHSIVLRLSYGRVNFLFSGDLNDESGRALTAAHNRGEINLQAEVFKVPHHGSADFSGALLQAVAPVVSVISSGDDNARVEYIHPRATLVGALGRYSRLEEPLVFVTELVAFFNYEGLIRPEFHRLDAKDLCVIKDNAAVLNEKARKQFIAFSRAAFGIVKIRTDGQRMLVYTNSGQSDLKEAYAYEVDDKGKVSPSPVRMA
ncbi:MAG TPA: MBL fold metallo-hydrolase, partial [Pyrinomonadaceae bacterium]|nr:MBL fold metallo-hydrolase [Pyrinomonadaceae bacterium]